ncbi:MAG: hypothetical protein JOZ19_03290 [Rubrobacter sp.]|nr:hypothetical protein [Rubrobacter sp.]
MEQYAAIIEYAVLPAMAGGFFGFCGTGGGRIDRRRLSVPWCNPSVALICYRYFGDTPCRVEQRSTSQITAGPQAARHETNSPRTARTAPTGE